MHTEPVEIYGERKPKRVRQGSRDLVWALVGLDAALMLVYWATGNLWIFWTWLWMTLMTAIPVAEVATTSERRPKGYVGPLITLVAIMVLAILVAWLRAPCSAILVCGRR